MFMFCLHTNLHMVRVIAMKRKVKFRFLAATTLGKSTFKGCVFFDSRNTKFSCVTIVSTAVVLRVGIINNRKLILWQVDTQTYYDNVNSAFLIK